MVRVSFIFSIAVLVIIGLIPVGNAQQPATDSVADAAREPKALRGTQQKPAQAPETIVVPAGTKITVDISEENPPRNVSRTHSAKVVNIVQVGSTVVIPALSKVTIQESVGVMELIDVTVDGVRYELKTDRVARQEGSMSEATFTLMRSFTIRR
jgi:hypothetical protein